MKKNFWKVNLWSCVIGVALWTLVMLEFWCWMDPADALGFSILILLGVVPLVTLILSAVNAYHKGLRISVLLMPVVAAITGAFAIYFTFHLANILSNGKNPLDGIGDYIREVVLTDSSYGLYWAAVSAVGILLGWIVKFIKNIRKQR